RALDQRLEVLPDQRLAAGEVQLDHAERLRLPEHAEPVRGAEPVAMAREVEGVRAVHAAQRTAVGELRHQRVRPRPVARHASLRIRPRSAIAARKAATSRSRASRDWAVYFSARRSMIAATVCSPVHSCTTSAAVAL